MKRRAMLIRQVSQNASHQKLTGCRFRLKPRRIRLMGKWPPSMPFEAYRESEPYREWRYRMWLKGYGFCYSAIDLLVRIGMLVPFEPYASRIGEPDADLFREDAVPDNGG